MNKTVTANISGFVFHIEEKAYETLSNYLNAIKGYLKTSATVNEIISDIEARIAELFQQKIKINKQVITELDVSEVIEILGAPEVFIEDDSLNYSQQNNKNEESAKDVNNNRVRRVFRNPDEKIVGGVCSGIGSYFNIDPLWIRLALVVAFFIFGFGFLLYVILWIIIPEAKTASEKLEMRGEKVNLKNIEKTIKNEFEDLKNRYNNPDAKDKIKNGIASFFNAVGIVIEYFFLALSKLIGAMVTVVGIILLTALISSFLGINNSIYFNACGIETQFTLNEFIDTIFENNSTKLLATIGLFILIAVPVSMLIYGGIRILWRIKNKNKIVSMLAGLVWTIGLFICIYIAIVVASSFKANNSTNTTISFKTPHQLKLQTSYYVKSFENTDCEADEKNFVTSARQLFRFAQLNIVKNDSNKVDVEVTKIARGINRKEAFERARRISYKYSWTDSSLTFEPKFSINKEEKWRLQNVKIEIKIPVGQVVFLEKGMEQILVGINNEQNTWDETMIDRRWIMTERGLNCIDCNNLETLK